MPNRESVTDKVSKSAVALIVRQIFVFVINVAGGIMLARLLTAEEFGIYAIVAFAMNFLKVFGDVGLAASLIRKKEEPTSQEYAAIFTIQQILVAGAVVTFWIIAPWLVEQYELAGGYTWLFRLVALSLVATSFMVIPQVKLERDLSFDKIAVIEVSQTVAFNVVAVLLAWYGYGAFALGWGLVARSVAGGVLANVVQPWAISLKWQYGIVKKHLRFGLPFQATSLIGTINSALNPVLIAMVFGMASAGYVEWAIILVGYLQRPLLLLNRLLFPTYSRLRENRAKLGEAVNYTYVASSLIFFGLAGILYGLAPDIVSIVYTDKWLPALPLLYLLVIANAFIPMSMPNGALAYALGWAKTVLYLNIGKSLFLWFSVIVLINILDSYIAYGYAMILTETLHLVLYFMLKRSLPAISILKTQAIFAAAALFTGLTIAELASYNTYGGVIYLISALGISGIIYIAYSYLLYTVYKIWTDSNIVYYSLSFLYKNIKRRIKNYQ